MLSSKRAFLIKFILVNLEINNRGIGLEKARTRERGVKSRGIKTSKNTLEMSISRGNIFWPRYKNSSRFIFEILSPREFWSSFCCPRGVQISEFFISRNKNIEIPKTRILHLEMSIVEELNSRKNLEEKHSRNKCLRKPILVNDWTIKVWFINVNIKQTKT